MNLFSSMGVSSSGMDAEQRRMEASAYNLSIVHVAATPGKESVQLRSVRVTEAGAIPGEDPTFSQLMTGNDGMRGVTSEEMAQPAPPTVRYEPGNPLADANGMVSYPNVNYLTEMSNLMTASRSFEANVTAYTEARSMLQKALEIGRG
jgi:flagellar basal-body rod protein FlgC